MKKRWKLVCLAAVLLLGIVIFIKGNGRDVQFTFRDDGTQMQVEVRADSAAQHITPWYDEQQDIYYFFMPAFVNDSILFFDEIGNAGISIDGEHYRRGGSFSWESGAVYQFRDKNSDLAYRVSFMKSENIPALFVNTDSGSMEYLNSDKENEEAGHLVSVTADGNVEYNGRLKKLSGRGNSTWDSYKKPYSVTLPDTYSLCGLEAGRKWNLLALTYESDKIHSKLVYDMAQELGMQYAVQCTWVDLYCNGEYQGLYLLTEAVTVGDGRVEIQELTENDTDISGGYFLEKEIASSVLETNVGVYTKYASFIVHNPKQPTEEQLNYISGYMNWVETKILAGDGSYRDCVDEDSFAAHLILENIALDDDGMVRSTFFYKDKGDDKLYLGPVWDYDRSMGEGYTNDYDSPVFMAGMDEWYQALYEDEYFRDSVKMKYQNLRSYLQYVLDDRIDNCADEIRASRAMDAIIERANKGSAPRLDEAVCNLKAYLAGRLEYLDGLWGEDAD
jgi:hypothetical protein